MLNEIYNISSEEELCCEVLIVNVKEVITTRRHEKMAFVEVEDATGKKEIIFFPPFYKTCKKFLKVGNNIYLTCKSDISYRSNAKDDLSKIKIIGIKVQPIEEK